MNGINKHETTRFSHFVTSYGFFENTWRLELQWHVFGDTAEPKW